MLSTISFSPIKYDITIILNTNIYAFEKDQGIVVKGNGTPSDLTIFLPNFLDAGSDKWAESTYIGFPSSSYAEHLPLEHK